MVACAAIERNQTEGGADDFTPTSSCLAMFKGVKTVMGKIGGRKIGTVKGLTVTVNHLPAKKRGKDRLWIQIRQHNGKRWRVYETLAYAKSVDVLFVAEK